MELIFKLPPNKPPFLGVVFDKSDHKAGHLNQDLLFDYAEVTICGIIDLKEPITLTLKSYSNHFEKRVYTVDLNKDKLALFISKTAKAEVYNFGHVINDGGKHQIAKTIKGNQNFVIKLYGLQLEDSFNYE